VLALGLTLGLSEDDGLAELLGDCEADSDDDGEVEADGETERDSLLDGESEGLGETEGEVDELGL